MFGPEFRARLRYEFDKTMAAGPIALIGWLGMVIIVAAGMMGTALRARALPNPPAEER